MGVLELKLKPARKEQLYGSTGALLSQSFLWDSDPPADLLPCRDAKERWVLWSL